jgi:hypothetical protein
MTFYQLTVPQSELLQMLEPVLSILPQAGKVTNSMCWVVAAGTFNTVARVLDYVRPWQVSLLSQLLED